MNRTYPWVSSCLRNPSQPTPALFTQSFILFALIGFVLSPLGAHASALTADAEASSYHIATLDHENYIRSVSFSPDGTLLATSEELIPTVRLWDVASRQQVATLELEGWSSSLSFSPDGSLLAVAEASGGGGEVSLWDTASRLHVGTLYPGGPKAWNFRSLSFSPDGTLLAVGASGGGEVSIWNVATRQRVASFQPGDFGSLVSFSPDGSLLATAEGRDNNNAVSYTISLWDAATRERVATLQPGGWEGYVESLSFSPDGSLLATAGELNQLWDIATRQEIPLQPKSSSSALSFSSDGALLAVGTVGREDQDRPILLWDVASRQQVATLVQPAYVSSLSFSPDGSLLASGGSDGTIRLWDVSKWKPPHPAKLVKISGDNQQSTPGTALARPLVIEVRDQHGKPLPNANVTFSVTSGGGTLASTTATTDASGRTRNTLTLGSVPGTNTVTATVMGLEKVTFTAITTDQTPHSLTKVSGDSQTGPASTQLAAPFVVSVLDQDGKAFAGASVTFSVTAGGGMLLSTTGSNPCTVVSSTSSATATTDANGRAAIRLTLGSELGTNTVTATVAELEPATFTATAAEQASPHSLTKVCGDSQEGAVNELLAKPFVVSVLDEDGAAIAGVVVSFSVTAGGGTLSAATATTDANGRAAIRLTLGSDAGPNTVSASVAGLASATFTATGQKSALASLFDSFLGGGKLVALPDHTQLLPNAPNPFNSQTVVSYFLLEPGLTRLEVFALTGQRVAVLHQGPQQAGYHRLHWDGRDAAGRSVASGIYLYRLVTSEDVLTRKLVLLR